jgi:Ca2+-binding RTX toxin-like protein
MINGGGGSDRLFGEEGSDRLFGEEGNDIIAGGGDADLLYGGAGKDRLRGGIGDDILVGGSGKNSLTGGAGADGFMLSRSFNVLDTITDFQDGIDLLGLPDGTCLSQLVIQQKGADTLVSYSYAPFKMIDDPIALLKGVQANTITIADFAKQQIVV